MSEDMSAISLDRFSTASSIDCFLTRHSLSSPVDRYLHWRTTLSIPGRLYTAQRAETRDSSSSVIPADADSNGSVTYLQMTAESPLRYTSSTLILTERP